jgi:hypothetical protein
VVEHLCHGSKVEGSSPSMADKEKMYIKTKTYCEIFLITFFFSIVHGFAFIQSLAISEGLYHNGALQLLFNACEVG